MRSAQDKRPKRNEGKQRAVRALRNMKRTHTEVGGLPLESTPKTLPPCILWPERERAFD